MKPTPGFVLYLANRMKNYLGWLNTAMLLVVFLRDGSWSWFYLLAFPVLAAVTWVDYKFVARQELRTTFDISPIKKELKRIEEKIDEIKRG